MIDIREVSKIFLDFVYENGVLPDEIIRIIDDIEECSDGRKYVKYDISVILNILKWKNRYVAKSEDTVTYQKLKSIENNKLLLSKENFGVDTYKWLNESYKTLETLIDIRNDFFHNVSKKMDGDAFLELIKTMIKGAPEDYEREKFVILLENIKKKEDVIKDFDNIQKELENTKVELNKAQNKIKTLEVGKGGPMDPPPLIKQPNHVWTEQEEYICAKKYIDCYVIKKETTPLTALVEDVRKLCPDIGKRSMHMKMQNIKWVCQNLGISDTSPSKWLPSASTKCKTAVEKVLREYKLI